MSNEADCRVLLTGATGYLGSHLLAAFVERGYSVVMLKRSVSDLSRIAEFLGKVKSYDIDRVPLEIAFEECGQFDAVVHAAVNYGRGSGSTGLDVFNVNVLLSLQLLQAAVDRNTKAFYNMGTVLDPSLSQYALSKHQFKQWGKKYAEEGMVRFVNFNLEHIYGPGDDVSKFTTHLVRACLKNESSLPLTLGHQERDFIHVDDAVSACLATMRHCDTTISGYHEFDVGSGEVVSIREFVGMVKRLSRSQIRLDFGAVPYRKSETMHSQADISQLMHIGWRPKYDLASGLQHMIEQERRLISEETNACVT